MPPRTIYLSRMIGLYCILISLAMLANKQAYVAKVSALVHDPPVLLLAAILAVAMGLAMILAHNVWSGGALPVAVTLIGWLALLKGVVFFWLPADLAARYVEVLHYEQLFYAIAVVIFVLGAYLTYGGFKASAR